MRAWGIAVAVALGLAELCSIIVWQLGGNDTAQAVTLVGTFPLHLAGVRWWRVRRSPSPTPPPPAL